MIRRLVWASIRQRPGRSLLLLFGYALGVGVTVTLLSIGGALIAQARDQALVGDGDLIVLPEGIDLETLKTGGASSMFFTIDQATFLYREVLASERFDGLISAAAPWIDDELLYLDLDGELVPISAGATIPALATALEGSPELVAGSWGDIDADRSWRAPTDAELYRSMDRLHYPGGSAIGDTTWAEWHYFNVLLPEDAGWLYLTYMIAGEVPDGRWGGRLLATWVDPGAGERVYTLDAPPEVVRFAAGEPDLDIAGSRVHVDRAGVYRLTARIPAETGGDTLTVDLALEARSRRYLPPLDIGGTSLVSGYTVPVLDGRSAGMVCARGRCLELADAVTYHDHNWGTWNAVTWDWGQASAGRFSLLYGGVAQADRIEGSRFVYLADDDGFAGIYPIRDIVTEWREDGLAPARITVHAARGRDSLALAVSVGHVRATDVPTGTDALARFFQMRGEASLSGRLRGEPLDERGQGFFETWTSPARRDEP
ncbi:MAG: hypothetical protein MJB57_01100 [Gemmatimonadetes bacterium]|nr:hypothetical protein [Gemmatimonadota bacterium]